MSLEEILKFLYANRGQGLLYLGIVMTMVQVAPIRVDPWSAMFRWLGNHLNAQMIDKLDTVEARLDQHIQDSEEEKLSEMRSNILDFGSSVLRGENYHKEKFDFMIAICDKYETICRDNQIKNGVTQASIEEIRRVYHDHLSRDGFLV